MAGGGGGGGTSSGGGGGSPAIFLDDLAEVFFCPEVS